MPIRSLLSQLASPLLWSGFAVVLVGLLLLRAIFRRVARGRVRYRAKGFLLSAGERRFAEALEEALPSGVVACPKVRLRDVIEVPVGERSRAAGGRIACKHLDFVLIEAGTSRILAAVELDDRSHDRADRRERDAFVDAALGSAGVPILHVRVARRYDPESLLDPIAGALRRARRAA